METEHYLIAWAPAQVRIYAAGPPPGGAWRQVEALDCPVSRGVPPLGASVERIAPASFLGVEVENFLQTRPSATWDLAASPNLRQPILEQLSRLTRAQLRRTLSPGFADPHPNHSFALGRREAAPNPE